MKYTKTPLALITGFKAGTALTGTILKLITDLDEYEPDIIPGERKYYNPEQLQFKDNHFYVWHIIPITEVVEKLNRLNVKTIFVVRNIYDIVVSIYYHFYNDIDSEVGRGNGKDTFLKQFSFEEGISLIITGFDENGLRWNGMSEVIIHYNEIFKASTNCDNILLNYDEIVENKYNVVKRLYDYIQIDTTEETIQNIVDLTSFNKMKNDAIDNNGAVSHYRIGKAKHNRTSLSEYHKIQLRQMIKVTANDMYTNAKTVNMQAILEL